MHRFIAQIESKLIQLIVIFVIVFVAESRKNEFVAVENRVNYFSLDDVSVEIGVELREAVRCVPNGAAAGRLDGTDVVGDAFAVMVL